MRETPSSSAIPVPEHDPDTAKFRVERKFGAEMGAEMNQIDQMRQLIEANPYLLLSDIIEHHGSVAGYKQYLEDKAKKRLTEDTGPETLAA